jgi:hypothetical protein
MVISSYRLYKSLIINRLRAYKYISYFISDGYKIIDN